MRQSITSTDLDEWSRTRDAQAHLPTLVRRLVMATVDPDDIRVPAAEGVSTPGFDGVVRCDAGAPPYLPADLSVWEVGTDARPTGKAERDYTKRLGELDAAARAQTTFVFVTSRNWPGAAAWAAAKAAGGDGWAGVVARDATDLATWLETRPGVAAWLSQEHLHRPTAGVTALRDWFEQWAERTEPPVPAALRLSGREAAAAALLAALSGPPTEHVVSARGTDEAVAFVGSALPAVPVHDPAERHEPSDEPSAASGTGPDDATDSAAASADPTPGAADAARPDADREASRREALLERAVVVHDPGAWRQWAGHESHLVLLPAFDDAPVDAAVRSGHTVVLTRVARAGDTGRAGTLPALHRGRARAAWSAAGVPSPQADELARAARRSLTSLRRRIGRAGSFRRPAWAEGETGALVATLMLAGGWDDTSDADRTTVLSLTDRSTWRGLGRALAQLKDAEDAPVDARRNVWELVDVVDAFDAVGGLLVADDLDLFHEQAHRVLGEPDPALTVDPAQRIAAASRFEQPPSRRHSAALRRGMATALAVLGAVAGQRELAGGRTGQEHAAQAVRDLLSGADGDRWRSLAEVLPLLAEASPDTFLDAVEQSLDQDTVPVMDLFDEQGDPHGLGSSSRHTYLLWALETLAFSPRHVSRCAVVLGRLAERDPGGRLGNRPAESLAAALHVQLPQGAVDTATRLSVVDAVLRHSPAAGWALLLALVRSAESGLLIRNGPRFRDWPRTARPAPAGAGRTLDGLAERLAAAAGQDGDRWAAALGLVDRVPAAGREALLQGADDAWPALPEESRRAAVTGLGERADRYARTGRVRRLLADDGLRRLHEFLDAHRLPGPARPDEEMFGWWPLGMSVDPDDPEEAAALRDARRDAVTRALDQGLQGVVDLAERAEVPGTVGEALAALTEAHDDAVLDLLTAAPPAAAVARGLVSSRMRADEAWLPAVLRARPDLAAWLLLVADPDQRVLDQLAGLEADQQAAYWKAVQPWRVPDTLGPAFAEALLAYDRPFTAAWVLNHIEAEQPFPADLALRSLQLPLDGSGESLEAVPSPQYLIGRLLDRLEAAGTDPQVLADLEWYYLPVLHDGRPPLALFRRLAAEPELFAELIRVVYRADDADPGEDDAQADPPDGQEAAPGPADAEPRPSPQLAEAAWRLLHEWRTPSPGAVAAGLEPSSEQMLAWVHSARAAITDGGRGQVASVVIGEALSGPATDPDGTWPARAVRDVLEELHDTRVEQGLAIGKFNQRGVTVRGPYDGGTQERALAATFREVAGRVRDDWPRTGALLDSLADGYEADARREDASAARSAVE